MVLGGMRRWGRDLGWWCGGGGGGGRWGGRRVGGGEVVGEMGITSSVDFPNSGAKHPISRAKHSTICVKHQNFEAKHPNFEANALAQWWQTSIVPSSFWILLRHITSSRDYWKHH